MERGNCEDSSRAFVLIISHIYLQAVIRKIDWRVMVWAWIMFFSLDLDRSNVSQANTDNFLEDLHLTTDDFNLGNTLFKASASTHALATAILIFCD